MWLGETLAVAGLILSFLLVRETLPFARLEETLGSTQTSAPSFWHVFRNTSWGDRSLFAVCQAGLVNNLNDGMAWGLLPLFFTANGLPLSQVSILSALYPATWGITQLGTGEQARVELKLADRTKVKGYISESAADHFVVVDKKTGAATRVTYGQVQQVKGNNLSTGAKIAIGLGILAGILAIFLILENTG